MVETLIRVHSYIVYEDFVPEGKGLVYRLFLHPCVRAIMLAFLLVFKLELAFKFCKLGPGILVLDIFPRLIVDTLHFSFLHKLCSLVEQLLDSILIELIYRQILR